MKAKHACDDLELKIEPFMKETGSDRIIADNGSTYYAFKTQDKMEELVSGPKKKEKSTRFSQFPLWARV